MAESRFHTLLKKKIENAMQTRVATLVTGVPEDYAAYKFEVGYLTGLNDVLALCEETDREFE